MAPLTHLREKKAQLSRFPAVAYQIDINYIFVTLLMAHEISWH
jgi:hypothetical protein